MSMSEFVVPGVGILRIERDYRRCRKAYFLNDEPISADEYYFLFRENNAYWLDPEESYPRTPSSPASSVRGTRGC